MFIAIFHLLFVKTTLNSQVENAFQQKNNNREE